MAVFISYRRGDSAGHAGRLRDTLEQTLGPDEVFQDVTSLAPGEHFGAAIHERIGSADVVLVVIGRHWVDALDATGARRLDDPADVVRIEVETALASRRCTVPVLVDGAALPTAADVPPSMAPLLEAHAAELRDGSWAADVDRLVRTSGLGPAAPPGPGPSRRRRVVAALVVGALAVAVAVILWPQDPGDESAGDTPTSVDGAAADRPTSTADAARTVDADTDADADASATTPGTAANGSCPDEPDGEPQPTPAEPTGVGRDTEITVAEWYRLPAAGSRQLINVDLTVTAHDPGGLSLAPSFFNAKVGGIKQPDGSFCYHILDGEETLGRGDRVRILLTGTLGDGAPVEINLGGYGQDDGAIVVLNE